MFQPVNYANDFLAGMKGVQEMQIADEDMRLKREEADRRNKFMEAQTRNMGLEATAKESALAEQAAVAQKRRETAQKIIKDNYLANTEAPSYINGDPQALNAVIDNMAFVQNSIANNPDIKPGENGRIFISDSDPGFAPAIQSWNTLMNPGRFKSFTDANGVQYRTTGVGGAYIEKVGDGKVTILPALKAVTADGKPYGSGYVPATEDQGNSPGSALKFSTPQSYAAKAALALQIQKDSQSTGRPVKDVYDEYVSGMMAESAQVAAAKSDMTDKQYSDFLAQMFDKNYAEKLKTQDPRYRQELESGRMDIAAKEFNLSESRRKSKKESDADAGKQAFMNGMGPEGLNPAAASAWKEAKNSEEKRIADLDNTRSESASRKANANYHNTHAKVLKEQMDQQNRVQKAANSQEMKLLTAYQHEYEGYNKEYDAAQKRLESNPESETDLKNLENAAGKMKAALERKQSILNSIESRISPQSSGMATAAGTANTSQNPVNTATVSAAEQRAREALGLKAPVNPTTPSPPAQYAGAASGMKHPVDASLSGYNERRAQREAEVKAQEQQRIIAEGQQKLERMQAQGSRVGIDLKYYNPADLVVYTDGSIRPRKGAQGLSWEEYRQLGRK